MFCFACISFLCSTISRQELRAELALLVNAFQEKSKSLNDQLARAASKRAGLEADRAAVGKSYAEGMR